MRPFLEASTPFSDTYDPGRFLGRGSFADVWECTERDTGERFACKVVDKASILSPEARGDVERELHLLRKIKEEGNGVPWVVEFKEAREDEDVLRIVTEICEGGNLLELVQEHGPLPEQSAKKVFGQILSAVAFCHSLGILHRDIKPENILFKEKCDFLYTDSACSRGSWPLVEVKLADFGLAVLLRPGTSASDLVGNRWYTAPEVLQRQEYGLKADVWSMGVVFFFMLTGELPFEGETEDEVEEAVFLGRVCWKKERWGLLSSDARNLALRMLQPWPYFRSSAADLTSHRWLGTATTGDHSKEPSPRKSYQDPRLSDWLMPMPSLWRRGI